MTIFVIRICLKEGRNGGMNYTRNNADNNYGSYRRWLDAK